VSAAPEAAAPKAAPSSLTNAAMASRASALYAAVSNKRDGCLKDSSENEYLEEILGHEEIVVSLSQSSCVAGRAY
jgi:hypothetical protein